MLIVCGNCANLSTAMSLRNTQSMVAMIKGHLSTVVQNNCTSGHLHPLQWRNLGRGQLRPRRARRHLRPHKVS